MSKGVDISCLEDVDRKRKNFIENMGKIIGCFFDFGFEVLDIEAAFVKHVNMIYKAVQRMEELFNVNGFDNVVIDAKFQRLANLFDVSVSRHHDGKEFWLDSACFSYEFRPRHAGEKDVHNHDVDVFLLDEGEGIFSCKGGKGLKGVRLKGEHFR